jgi:hypothetical protein
VTYGTEHAARECVSEKLILLIDCDITRAQ